jgi:hypothetical protein
MNELSPRAQEALERARRAHDPSPASFSRVQRAFLAARAGLDAAGAGVGPDHAAAAAGGVSTAGAAEGLAAGAAPATTAGGSATLSSAGGALAKLLGGGKVGLAVVALAGGLYLAGAPPTSAPPPVQALPAVHSGAAEKPQLRTPMAEPAEGSPPPEVLAAPPSSSALSAPRTPEHVARRLRSTPSPAKSAVQLTAERGAPGALSTPDPEPSRADAREAAGVRAGIDAAELALLRSAVDQVGRGAHREALRTLDEHAARYPQTPLALERRGVRAIALCASGERASGRSERAAFLKEGVSSPLAARVRAACAEEKP